MIASFKVSVKDLAVFTARSGDLGSVQVSKVRGVEGIRAHRHYQESQPKGYRYEVAVAAQLDHEGIELQIAGRIDGLRIEESGLLLLDEIKSTRSPRDSLTEPHAAHRNQALVYAHLFALQEPWQQAEIRVVYLNLCGGEPLVFSEFWTAVDLAIWFDGVAGEYARWLRRLVEWQRERDASLRNLAFPFANYRAGQSEMVDAVAKAIENQQRLYVEAPTGIGKTVSALYPAVRSLPDLEVEKIFFLTAKNSGKRAAEQAVGELVGAGARLKSLTLIAKKLVCNRNGFPCDPSECDYAIGFFARLRSAVDAAFLVDAWTPEVVARLADEHRVCPFEFSLELARLADVVIADYNYLFDPRVQLRRFFADPGGPYVFLVDEAHNLPARARDMFSAELRRSELRRVKTDLGTEYPMVRRGLTSLLRVLDELQRGAREEGDSSVAFYDAIPEKVGREVARLYKSAERLLTDEPPSPLHGRVLELYFYLSAFLGTIERCDNRYAIFCEEARRDLVFKLLCLEPSRNILESLECGQATIFFSGTLHPMDYYKAHFGGDEMDPVLQLGSPFPSENLTVKIDDQIATTYRERDRSYDAIAAAIRAFVDGQSGNYLVFFPSFAYLDAVAKRFELEQNFGRLVVQQPGMSEVERRDFLARFNASSRNGFLGFAVMGGIFGEGIDLIGDALSGAIIIGVGLPQVCVEQELIRQHFVENGRDGFAYAYTYPGICRVLQAAGRVIRSGVDVGRILLIDRRYADGVYRELLPDWWEV